MLSNLLALWTDGGVHVPQVPGVHTSGTELKLAQVLKVAVWAIRTGVSGRPGVLAT